jgi:hypothetical protein
MVVGMERMLQELLQEPPMELPKLHALFLFVFFLVGRKLFVTQEHQLPTLLPE